MQKNKQPLIEINDLSFQYEKDKVLENINLVVHRGDFLGIVGPNGSGKSTLLKLLLGLLKKQSGEIYLFGEKMEHFTKWEKIGYVSQKSNAFNSAFPATVFEVVRSGLTKKASLFQFFFSKSINEKVITALKAVEMDEYVNRNIGELSGGQQQRVFIARAIVSEPELLILDEPTVGVDAKRVSQFYNLLGSLQKDKDITLILVTHDIGAVTEKITHVACINHTLHFHGDVNRFEEESVNLSSMYGHDVKILTHNHHEEGHE
ncbi:metal ABC transporter ATP-binding protein [Bacillus kwashiorkori]|uniref:metal ABC transporter ATP-binding protein n=1 Tax=Bacillus kwashiorkori TaxID=1522318 RepID=UPI000785DC67|nr:metal ABC transporter ATP-binding protein [Bacillus kwashiorkori]